MSPVFFPWSKRSATSPRRCAVSTHIHGLFQKSILPVFHNLGLRGIVMKQGEMVLQELPSLARCQQFYLIVLNPACSPVSVIYVSVVHKEFS